jgi:hypothetical protein
VRQTWTRVRSPFIPAPRDRPGPVPDRVEVSATDVESTVQRFSNFVLLVSALADRMDGQPTSPETLSAHLQRVQILRQRSRSRPARRRSLRRLRRSGRRRRPAACQGCRIGGPRQCAHSRPVALSPSPPAFSTRQRPHVQRLLPMSGIRPQAQNASRHRAGLLPVRQRPVQRRGVDRGRAPAGMSVNALRDAPRRREGRESP